MRLKKLLYNFLLSLCCLLVFFAGCTYNESSRDQLFDVLKIDPDSDRMPLGGISEWMTWYVAYDIEPPADSKKLIEQTIDIHDERGIDFIIWNCGRSTVAYQSDIAHTTRYCELGTMIGDKDWSFVARVLDNCCPLKHAVSYCQEKGMPILGRLTMNRHYGKKIHSGLTSRFAMEHPEYWEVAKNGVPMKDKLCYAIEEVRQERLDIMLEIQSKGVDALVLDYCRQMPILAYHDSLVIPYINNIGLDPREIESTNKEDYRDWFQYRADV
ncbi:hypothetical protein GF337_16210, partial [candidate division KSB1 bacterium]|nr:hypothetical protein [candidate division KSB1 bacterium]